jgi:hypothetical protein
MRILELSKVRIGHSLHNVVTSIGPKHAGFVLLMDWRRIAVAVSQLSINHRSESGNGGG